MMSAIPAQAGFQSQYQMEHMDPRLRGDDG